MEAGKHFFTNNIEVERQKHLFNEGQRSWYRPKPMSLCQKTLVPQLSWIIPLNNGHFFMNVTNVIDFLEYFHFKFTGIIHFTIIFIATTGNVRVTLVEGTWHLEAMIVWLVESNTTSL